MNAPDRVGRAGSGAPGRGIGARLRSNLPGWFFSLPFLLIFGVFLAGPILVSLVMSFTSFGLRDLRNPIGASFVGLENYVALASDATFWTAALNTAI